MLPALCLTFLGLIVLAVGMISVPLIGFEWSDEIRRYLDEMAASTGTKPYSVTEAVTSLWIFVVLAAGTFQNLQSLLLFYKMHLLHFLQQFSGMCRP